MSISDKAEKENQERKTTQKRQNWQTTAKALKEVANLGVSFAGNDEVLMEVVRQGIADNFPGVNASKILQHQRAELDHGQPSNPIEFRHDLSHVEFVVDGFDQAGITTISGATGCGKTTALVPLCSTVAHLNGKTELDPELRRHVVYLAEDPQQVERILYGIRKRVGGTLTEFNEWFHLIPSRRVSPATMAKWLSKWSQNFSYEKNGFKIGPLIVVDTVNANLDLENESDNAEVGRALSMLREVLGSCSLWLVTHLNKAFNQSSDPSELSARGAGAWEGDVNSTMVLLNDKAFPDKRFLKLKKWRFVEDYSEIEFVTEVDAGSATTPWGTAQRLPYRVASMTALAKGNGLAQQRLQMDADRKEAAIKDRKENVVNYLNKVAEHPDWNGSTQSEIIDGVGGNRKCAIGAIQSLIDSGDVVMKRKGNGITSPKLHWPRNRPPK